MSDYIVVFRVIGEQTVRVTDCKSKREAIRRAIYQDKSEPIEFVPLRILTTTAEAEKER